MNELIEKMEITEEQKNELKAKFKEFLQELNSVKSELTERDTQLKELSKKNKDNEDLVKQIEELQSKNKEEQEKHTQVLEEIKLENAINLELLSSGALDTRTFNSLLKKENIKFKDNKLEGLKEQLNDLKTTHKYLFKEEKTEQFKGFVPSKNADNTNKPSNSNGIMSYEDFLKSENNN